MVISNLLQREWSIWVHQALHYTYVLINKAFTLLHLMLFMAVNISHEIQRGWELCDGRLLTRMGKNKTINNKDNDKQRKGKKCSESRPLTLAQCIVPVRFCCSHHKWVIYVLIIQCISYAIQMTIVINLGDALHFMLMSSYDVYSWLTAHSKHTVWHHSDWWHQGKQ